MRCPACSQAATCNAGDVICRVPAARPRRRLCRRVPACAGPTRDAWWPLSAAPPRQGQPTVKCPAVGPLAPGFWGRFALPALVPLQLCADHFLSSLPGPRLPARRGEKSLQEGQASAAVAGKRPLHTQGCAAGWLRCSRVSPAPPLPHRLPAGVAARLPCRFRDRSGSSMSTSGSSA